MTYSCVFADLSSTGEIVIYLDISHFLENTCVILLQEENANQFRLAHEIQLQKYNVIQHQFHLLTKASFGIIYDIFSETNCCGFSIRYR